MKEIAEIKFPSITDYVIKDNGEKMINIRKLNNSNIIIRPYYYSQGVAGAPSSVWVRETVASMLNDVANKAKQQGYQLVVYDGWRPLVVQQRLWNYYYITVKNKHKDEKVSEEQLIKETSFYVSKPSENPENPFLHSTGGAVDVTLAVNGDEIDMGTKFDDFSNKAWTNHFEKYADDIEVRDNRRLLYNIMTEAGFTNLPSEWWHYDYGNKFWMYFNNKENAIYNGVLQLDVDCFPLI